MATFDAAIGYVLENEGGVSNDRYDHGGLTKWGITAAVAAANHRDIETLTLDEAKEIYQHRYWNFDQIADQRVATKMLDVCVNCGTVGGTKIIQRAVAVSADGLLGPQTVAAINALEPDVAIEAISCGVADYYIAIVRSDESQFAFLRGWIHRSIRRPK